MTLKELREATKADKTLQQLMQVIRSGEWSKIQSPQPDDVDETQLRLFVNVKDELMVSSDSDLILHAL